MKSNNCQQMCIREEAEVMSVGTSWKADAV